MAFWLRLRTQVVLFITGLIGAAILFEEGRTLIIGRALRHWYPRNGDTPWLDAIYLVPTLGLMGVLMVLPQSRRWSRGLIVGLGVESGYKYAMMLASSGLLPAWLEWVLLGFKPT